jgi:hypothetical protein
VVGWLTRGSGPPPYRNENRSRFLQVLERELVRLGWTQRALSDAELAISISILVYQRQLRSLDQPITDGSTLTNDSYSSHLRIGRAMAIPVGQIRFGEIDAKNEVFGQDRHGINVFENSFQIPPNIDIAQILAGSRYFVFGQKGCGKTALLLYTKKNLESSGATTRTILFKSGITEAERRRLATGKGFELVETDDGLTIEYDYKINWLWYIYRNLFRLLTRDHVYDGWDVAESLKEILGVKSEVATTALSDLATTRIKAHAKAGIKAGPFNAEIGAEIEAIKATGEDDLEVDIIQVVERYIGRIVLHPRKRIVLIFDELELFWNRPDQRERDLFLIRDLLYAVGRVNHTVGATSASFSVIAAARSEVLHEVERVGPEVSRDVDDFGLKINWNVRVADRDQPILKIVEAKIHASEVECEELPTDNVWEAYFPRKVFGRDFDRYLLDICMYRPRNIVNMLSLSQSYRPDTYVITFDAIDESQAEFSRRTWREVEEELLGEFTPDTVSAIKSLLTGFESHFAIQTLKGRLRTLSAIDRTVAKAIPTEEALVGIVKTLYRVGALGNRYYVTNRRGKREWRFNWIFRDNSDPVMDREFVVHESLRKQLQLPFN